MSNNEQPENTTRENSKYGDAAVVAITALVAEIVSRLPNRNTFSEPVVRFTCDELKAKLGETIARLEARLPECEKRAEARKAALSSLPAGLGLTQHSHHMVGEVSPDMELHALRATLGQLRFTREHLAEGATFELSASQAYAMLESDGSTNQSWCMPAGYALRAGR